MKKKIIIPIVLAILILIVGIVSFIIIRNNEVSIITLDINPSISISVNRSNKVVDVVALNEDAKKIVSDDLKGKKLDELFEVIVEKSTLNGYINENYVDVIIYSKGSIKKDFVKELLSGKFTDKDIAANITVIDKITKEDEELSKKYNISLGKAAYINSVKEKNEDIDVSALVDKPVSEIKETKEKGFYCDAGYMLEGTMCLKEIDRKEATPGEVCPRGYMEYNGKCYEETGPIEGENYRCREGFEMLDGKCKMTSSYVPNPDCGDNNYKSDINKCIELVYIADAYEYCRDPGRTLYDHKCLATKPSINGGCLGSDMYFGGKCLNPINDYYMAEWMCPNGKNISNHDGTLLNEDHKCYEESYVDPKPSECDKEFTLIDGKCVHEEVTSPEKEMLCPSGYFNTENGRCINLNNTKEFESGFVCDEPNTRVENNTCIIYEIIDAQH